MLNTRVTLKNLKNLTYIFLDSDNALAMELNKKLTQLFDEFYLKVSPGDLLMHPVTKERVRMIKCKYRKLSCPAWKVSSLPRYAKGKTKKIKIVKVCLNTFMFTEIGCS